MARRERPKPQGEEERLDLTRIHDLLRAPLAMAAEDPNRLTAIQAAIQQLTPTQFHLFAQKVKVDDLIRAYNQTYHNYDADDPTPNMGTPMDNLRRPQPPSVALLQSLFRLREGDELGGLPLIMAPSQPGRRVA